jgi:hypothetical protein
VTLDIDKSVVKDAFLQPRYAKAPDVLAVDDHWTTGGRAVGLASASKRKGRRDGDCQS